MKLTKTKAYYRMKTCTSILMSIFCKFSIHPRGVYGAATFSHDHIVYIIYFLKLFTSFHSFFFHIYTKLTFKILYKHHQIGIYTKLAFKFFYQHHQIGIDTNLESRAKGHPPTPPWVRIINPYRPLKTVP